MQPAQCPFCGLVVDRSHDFVWLASDDWSELAHVICVMLAIEDHQRRLIPMHPLPTGRAKGQSHD